MFNGIIQFLANVSGVTAQTRDAAVKDIGMRLKDASYWMGGSVFYHYENGGELKMAKEVLMIIGNSLYEYQNFSPDRVRTELYEIMKEEKAKKPDVKPAAAKVNFTQGIAIKNGAYFIQSIDGKPEAHSNVTIKHCYTTEQEAINAAGQMGLPYFSLETIYFVTKNKTS